MEVLGCNLVEDTGVGGVELPAIHYLGQCQGTSLIVQMGSCCVPDPRNDKPVRLAV